MDLKEEDILGSDIDSHWYYKNKSAALTHYLSQCHYSSILDVGAGSGFFTKYLLSHTAAARGLCVDTSYAQDWSEEVSDKPINYRQSCDAVNTDLVLLMDVLEHVEDDVGLLQSYIEKTQPGTHFLITVPAFQFLWSGHDVFLEHYRRYTRQSLCQVIRSAGLVEVKSSYYFGAVFPIAAGLRLVENLLNSSAEEAKSSLKKHHPVTNSILSGLCRLELPFIDMNKLAGLSVFCLCIKK